MIVCQLLLTAKSRCYDKESGSLRLLLNYLTNRKQRTKTGSPFTTWCDINTGVSQGSVFGLLLFNIFINDLFIHNKVRSLQFCG